MDFIDEYYADKDLSLLKKLTLVIPTYNRNYYLSRCLWYHAHFPFGEIIVADSSLNDKRKINKDTIKEIVAQFNIKITHLEYDQTPGKYGEGIFWKWGDGVQHVSTEYSQICTDKEFGIPTTQHKCIEFLESNPDFGAVDGEYYYVEKVKSGRYGLNKFYDTKCSLPYDDAIVRYLVSVSKRNASTNLMAIRKTENHKHIYRQLEKYRIDDIRFSEFTQEFLTIIDSKMHYFANLPFNCRDLTNLRKYGLLNKSESSDGRSLYLNQYIVDGIYDICMERTVECLSNTIRKNTMYYINDDDLKKIILETLPDAIRRRGFYGDSWYKKITSFHPIITLVIHLLKPYVKEKIIKRKTKLVINTTDEFEIIKKIIYNTRRYYSNDMSIITIK